MIHFHCNFTSSKDKTINMSNITLVDFFCGAGGFSEGFKQAGIKIIQGIEVDNKAIETFNFNFNLQNDPLNILDVAKTVENIESLVLDSNIIVGSPPCVSFSSSNKAGNADKSLGIELIMAFLKIVVVKQYKTDSILQGWFMENVANSKEYLNYKKGYTFKELGLESWCTKIKHKTKKRNLLPTDIAITPYENTYILNSNDFGSFQSRKRAITGFYTDIDSFIPPKPHSKNTSKTLGDFFQIFPSPLEIPDKNETILDPNYKTKLSVREVTDHYYDTRIHNKDADLARRLKTNHPYMGKMSFPENTNKPVRTITATKISMARESIIFAINESNRFNTNHKYRMPTVREAACFMGFPLTFQFSGSESRKWRQIGNAVCPTLSYALAKDFLNHYKLDIGNRVINEYKEPNFPTIKFNDFKERNVQPSIKSKTAKFRSHYIKKNNITITFSNYQIKPINTTTHNWYSSIQKGTGKNSIHIDVNHKQIDSIKLKAKSILSSKERILCEKLTEYICSLELDHDTFTSNYVNRIDHEVEPHNLIDYISLKISSSSINWSKVDVSTVINTKQSFKIESDQLIALYLFVLTSKILNND